MDQVDCTELFSPIFQSTTGQLVQATPKVQTIQIQLSKPEELGYHVDTLDHVKETDSLLYTKKRDQGIQQIILSPEKHESLKLFHDVKLLCIIRLVRVLQTNRTRHI